MTKPALKINLGIEFDSRFLRMFPTDIEQFIVLFPSPYIQVIDDMIIQYCHQHVMNLYVFSKKPIGEVIVIIFI